MFHTQREMTVRVLVRPVSAHDTRVALHFHLHHQATHGHAHERTHAYTKLTDE